jgi:hypothetical protein
MVKRFIWGAFIILLIIFTFSGITNAFFGYANPQRPISEASSLLLLGSGLIGIATWGRKKFR